MTKIILNGNEFNEVGSAIAYAFETAISANKIYRTTFSHDSNAVMQMNGGQFIHIWVHCYVGNVEYRCAVTPDKVEYFKWITGRGWTRITK